MGVVVFVCVWPADATLIQGPTSHEERLTNAEIETTLFVVCFFSPESFLKFESC